MSALIPLYGRSGLRGHAVVDEADFECLSQWRWHLAATGYAARRERKIVLMHRQILGLEYGDARVADHVDRDKLNNTRANLRAISRAANAQNIVHGYGESGYRGVVRNKGKWTSQVVVDGKHHYLGRFADPRKAAEVAAAFRAVHMPFSPDATAMARG